MAIDIKTIYENDRDSKSSVDSGMAELLAECLESLCDLQNGPPLIRHEKEWQEVMNKSRDILTVFYGKNF